MNNNLITLKGTIKRDIESRFSEKSGEYYFTFLTIEGQTDDLPVFLWQPDYETKLKAEQDLTADAEVILFGKYNKDQTTFYLKEWIVEGLEIFN